MINYPTKYTIGDMISIRNMAGYKLNLSITPSWMYTRISGDLLIWGLPGTLATVTKVGRNGAPSFVPPAHYIFIDACGTKFAVHYHKVDTHSQKI